MSCLISLKGIPYACEVNLSGIKNLWLADWNEIGVTVDDSTGTISTITGLDVFEKFAFAKNTGSLTKTMTKDDSKGTRYFLNEVTANFNRMDKDKRKVLNALAAGQIAAIVEDMNHIYWYLGKDNYATATAVTGQTGAATDDGNFYVLTIQDMSGELPYSIDASALTGLIDAK